jgi:hypothetical protein
MALNTDSQIYNVNIDQIGINTSERGGMLSYSSASGMLVLEYLPDPSGFKPAGIQYNDIEFFEQWREPYPKTLRRSDEPLAIVGVVMDGDIETNWVHPVGTIMPGDSAYVGPSGTLTNSSSFGGVEVGHFTSTVTNDPQLLTFKGLGTSRIAIDPATKAQIHINNPADRVLIVSPGFVKVHLNMRRRIR